MEVHAPIKVPGQGLLGLLLGPPRLLEPGPLLLLALAARQEPQVELGLCAVLGQVLVARAQHPLDVRDGELDERRDVVVGDQVEVLGRAAVLLG